MANNRVYYAIQQVSFGKHSGGASRTMKAAHGVQSVGITTTFNLDQVFELGQLAIYENIEGTPDIEVTLSKVLDGYMPLYCLATADQTSGPQLNKRALARCFVQLGIWEESFESAGESSSDPTTWVEMSGLYLSSVSYNFPLDDNFSEDITLVGNYKVWGAGQQTVLMVVRFPTHLTWLPVHSVVIMIVPQGLVALIVGRISFLQQRMVRLVIQTTVFFLKTFRVSETADKKEQLMYPQLPFLQMSVEKTSLNLVR